MTNLAWKVDCKSLYIFPLDLHHVHCTTCDDKDGDDDYEGNSNNTKINIQLINNLNDDNAMTMY